MLVSLMSMYSAINMKNNAVMGMMNTSNSMLGAIRNVNPTSNLEALHQQDTFNSLNMVKHQFMYKVAKAMEEQSEELLQEDTEYIELEGNETTQVYAYDKYICVYRNKKVEFYNKVGTKVDEMELDINKAVFTSAGRYMAICENSGKKFYLICGREKIYENEVEGHITQIDVSRNGFVSASIIYIYY